MCEEMKTLVSRLAEYLRRSEQQLNARVDNDNPDAALTGSWTQWNISLQAFADQGVNLTNVNSITLGLSSVTGGTGMMYFDDIQLHPPAQ